MEKLHFHQVGGYQVSTKRTGVQLRRAALAGDWRARLLSKSSMVGVGLSQALSSEVQLRSPFPTLKLLETNCGRDRWQSHSTRSKSIYSLPSTFTDKYRVGASPRLSGIRKIVITISQMRKLSPSKEAELVQGSGTAGTQTQVFWIPEPISLVLLGSLFTLPPLRWQIPLVW